MGDKWSKVKNKYCTRKQKLMVWERVRRKINKKKESRDENSKLKETK